MTLWRREMFAIQLTVVKLSASSEMILCGNVAPDFDAIILMAIPCDVSWLENHSATISVILSCTNSPSFPPSGKEMFRNVSKIILCWEPWRTFAISMSMSRKFFGSCRSVDLKCFLLCTKIFKIACETTLFISCDSVNWNTKCDLWRDLTAAERNRTKKNPSSNYV